MESITTNADELRGVRKPLYHKYPGQCGPQPAYLELDPENRTIFADWNGEIGNAVPMNVWNKVRGVSA